MTILPQFGSSPAIAVFTRGELAIENAIFFDLEKYSNQQKNLPHNHFLPKKKDWEKTLSEMGISNSDKVVIYDNSDLITCCRCWFQFLFF